MDCYTSSHLIGKMQYVYALTDKQWQNVGGGMNQAHAAEVTHVRKLSDDILYVQHFNYYLSAFIKHRHATAT